MSMKELSLDDVANSLTKTIMNLQQQLESERKKYINNIKQLKEMLKEKDEEINELKEKLASMNMNKDDQSIISVFRQDKEFINQELEKKVKELTDALFHISELNDQIDTQKQNIMNLEMDKKELNQKIVEENKKYEKLESKFNTLQKKLDLQIGINDRIIYKLKEKKIKIEGLNNDLDIYNKLYNEDNNYSINQVKPSENIISVNFVSMSNQKIINCNLICKTTDLFARLEERLYQDFPELTECNTFFEVNGNKIKNYKKIEENNIKNNDIIFIYI